MVPQVEEYRKFAIAHGNATRNGDSDATNIAYSRLAEIAARIIQSGQGLQLLTLFNDSDLWVQLWASTHALGVAESDSISKLTELEHSSLPLVGMTAHYTIQSWRAGELQPIQ
jgi:hypothetical protein